MDFLNVDNLITEQDLFDLTTGGNALNDAWLVPAFPNAFPERSDFAEGIGDNIAAQGSKRPRGRTFTCDGRRPICHNCQRSRGYICRGFVENLRQTETGPKAQVSHSERATKVRRTDSRRHAVEPMHHHPHSGADVISQDVPDPSQRQLSTDNYVTSVPNTLRSESVQDDLLHHYRSIVTGVMMPTIDSASNPWLQIYFNLAFGNPSTTSQSSLRHALISVAAYQRASQQRGSRQKDIERARSYGQKAEKLLEQVANIGEGQHTQSLRDKCTSVAAALSLISIDVFDPRGIDCRAHLHLARRIIQLYATEQTWKSNAILNMLYQILLCYETVANTARLTETSCSSPSQQQGSESGARDTDEAYRGREEEEGLEQFVTNPQHFILNSSFGVSWRTLSLLQQTIKLGSLCTRTIFASPALLSQVKDLHRHLCSFEDDPSQFLVPTSKERNISCLANGVLTSDLTTVSSTDTLPKVISDELVENLQLAFHYAVIVYFHRVIPAIYQASLDNDTPDGHVRHSSARNKGMHHHHQTLISNIWDRLENIDCITPRETQLQRGNVMWPAFIAAVESIQVELRHRALIWFSKAAERGVGNVLEAKKVVLEVWRRVDRLRSRDDEPTGLGPIDWRAVMHDMDSHIMLT
ncbi:hypothetical protein BU24DRAFT_488166 [Aaosphaeria arxii CBS 175.79]|uniref:Zn(2)-C6 fungal-type domain-containing protein n=1 Tax=Aaosphaeria arxii CBS 175.79 TaxID=1450172 RepID=A0A6A5Y9Z1_9PLEO|nr:uncharacterized protein BU24DRAFT_488166 [Aaosphaeria arxii CBS 175.79]KAF2021827.1 hypothetical protein BU24DRAFT_488166 [Aaosphaeria arxii CBS 175.79]